MTLNEKKQLTNYIKGLVRESINEMPLPDGFFQGAKDLPNNGPYAEFGGSMPKILKIYKDQHPEGVIAINPDDRSDKVFIPADAIKTWKEDYVAVSQKDFDKYFGGEEEDEDNGILDNMKQDDEEPAGINELRQLAESMARQALTEILSENKKKKGKRKNKKEKTSSKDKTVVSKLNSDGTNAAHYFYKLYGVENGTETEKAAARSKGYKKAKGKKNDTGVPYKFTSKERNRLNSLLTDR